MNALFRAAADVLSFCEERGWQCCVIGGLAVQRWSDPRLTRDADLTLFTGLGGEERFVEPLLAEFLPRVQDARTLALHRRVLLLQTGDGVPIDVALGGLPFESRVMGRRSHWNVPGHVDLITCSAEDLVVMKAFGRPACGLRSRPHALNLASV